MGPFASLKFHASLIHRESAKAGLPENPTFWKIYKWTMKKYSGRRSFELAGFCVGDRSFANFSKKLSRLCSDLSAAGMEQGSNNQASADGGTSSEESDLETDAAPLQLHEEPLLMNI